MAWHHVYPVNDLIEHTTDTNDADCCICGPTIDVENELIIHAAMDRRECFEKKEEK